MYGNDVRIVYRHFVVHPNDATIPAQAACAANLQGRFKPMDKLIWEKGFLAGRNLSRDNMVRLAGKARLDVEKFKKDLKGKCRQVVRDDQAAMAGFGVRGTPAFFINGRFLSGARPFDHFKNLIDEELARAKERIAAGTSVRAYYEKWVLGPGKKGL